MSRGTSWQEVPREAGWRALQASAPGTSHYLRVNTRLRLPAGRPTEAEGAGAHGGLLQTLTGPGNRELNSALRPWKEEPGQRGWEGDLSPQRPLSCLRGLGDRAPPPPRPLRWRSGSDLGWEMGSHHSPSED